MGGTRQFRRPNELVVIGVVGLLISILINVSAAVFIEQPQAFPSHPDGYSIYVVWFGLVLSWRV